ncbi:MAG: GNAT family N-acetyltransferase [Bacteroidales bacterium]|jgi:hypothetical protein|nr:GNAT family N-acetyltransferase [Bacteroidales bacterium]
MDYEFVRHTDTPENILRYSTFLSAPFVTSSNYVDRARASTQYLRWQYFCNPVGSVIGYSALYKGEIVAHFSNIPVRYCINGTICKSLLALNLVTHPEHRGRGLFIEMAERSFGDAFSEGFEYIGGVANQNSTHGLVNRLGFDLVAPLEIRAGYGDVPIDRKADYHFRTLWDEESLHWRLANPSARYFLSKGEYVVAATGKYGVMAQVRHLDGGEAFFTGLPSISNRLRVWMGLARRTKKLTTHIRLPRHLRPVPLNFILKSLRGERVIPDPRDVLFELIDFDAY